MNEQPNRLIQIDRLAAGDLDDDARRDLFTWLDGEPVRWRRCTFALLESRELEQAFDVWKAEAARPAIESIREAAARRRRPVELFVLAASVVIAFGLGLFVRGSWHSPAPMVAASPKQADAKAPIAASDKAASPEAVEQRGAAPDKAVAATVPSAARSDLIPPYVRSQWERRGYQVKSQQVKLPVILPDGNRMMVPGNEVQFNYVGQRTY